MSTRLRSAALVGRPCLAVAGPGAQLGFYIDQAYGARRMLRSR